MIDSVITLQLIYTSAINDAALTRFIIESHNTNINFNCDHEQLFRIAVVDYSDILIAIQILSMSTYLQAEVLR